MVWYHQPEIATIVSIKKERHMSSILRMEITAQVQRTGQEVSFSWVMAPTVITSKSYGNKAPEQFETFWENDGWEGREVFLYHSLEAGYAYMKPCE